LFGDTVAPNNKRIYDK
jgi:uncharacterized DUF497 family protein